MKTLIKIGIVALCLVGCDSETPVVSNGRTVYVRDDAWISYVEGENGRLVECVIFDGFEGTLWNVVGDVALVVGVWQLWEGKL